MRSKLAAVCLTTCAALALTACSDDDDDHQPSVQVPPPSGGGSSTRPNILFVIMDDVGIDQMASFGYGGNTPPAMPNMDAVADAGIRFRNTWSMPECSPGRAAFFTGRYPHRTNIYQAIGPNDLANSQVSPYEITTPKLLKKAGYASAMFGKFHLTGSQNNQAGLAAPGVLGWDYYYGWGGELPGAIDTTAGGVGENYTCGYVPGKAHGGADIGACYYADNTCAPMSRSGANEDPPGMQCLASGGIFVPEQTCASRAPASLNFNKENAHYVGPLIIVDDGKLEEVAFTDARARGYRGRIEADAAIEWINARKTSVTPWMATVSFSAAHTPLQTPPGDLLPGISPAADALDCADATQGRVVQNQMTEAMDAEFGRILVETGLATRGADGRLSYDPASSNTVIVIAGDNGTLGFSVKTPFNAGRAKGTAYQTGLWVPLVVAGAHVSQPGRNVEHMVNAVDLFQLFGELAGLDVAQSVPRTIDSAALMPYLENPAQDSIRTINFAMGGANLQANGATNAPCLMNGNTCSITPMSKGICEDNQGVWWGPGHDDDSVIPNGEDGYQTCWQVNQALYEAGLDTVNVMPTYTVAIRNDQYKLVQNTAEDYDVASGAPVVNTTTELYRIDQAPSRPRLDNAEHNLLAQPPLRPEAQQAYDELMPKLQATLDSNPACPGDGNQDGVVDTQDMSNWRAIAESWGLSSVYDFVTAGGADGLTDASDGLIIQQNMGTACKQSYALH